MKIYTYSEARQRLATLLDQASDEGIVQIRRRDGQLFALQPIAAEGSPLDVVGVSAKLPKGELEAILRESRESGNRFWRRPSTEGSKQSLKPSKHSRNCPPKPKRR